MRRGRGDAAGMFRDHLLHVRRARSAALSCGRGRFRRNERERACPLTDGALDRLVFDVVAATDGLQPSDRRMQLLGAIHVGEANTGAPHVISTASEAAA